jgi:two-component system, NtrC family, sensor kinase
VLKIAARYPGQLKPFDAELVEHFRSQAAIAIQNLHRTESLRARVVMAERKHAMADLARSLPRTSSTYRRRFRSVAAFLAEC